MEVTPKMRTLLRRDDRIKLYIEWHSCTVQDFRGVTRCFKCQMYGHIAKFCRDEESTCSYCAETNHISKECPAMKAGKPAACPPCKRAKKRSDHSVLNKSCPAYKAALERVINRTNYGAEQTQ